ncbi:hypothetical protein [Paenibacillus sp. UMB4589-SE434]|nr:hypothetical protein [Paenibacillus sp. UMB4589-SE434]MDK8179636.1 hypothetical protein [Paenibacillus sp. UMB4589-SE434]
MKEIKNFGLTFNVEEKTNDYLKGQQARFEKIKQTTVAVTETPEV